MIKKILFIFLIPVFFIKAQTEIPILNNYANKNCTISRIDGIKLDFENYWIHLRKSNTEPIIRIITEAKNKIEAEKNQKEFMDSLK